MDTVAEDFWRERLAGFAEPTRLGVERAPAGSADRPADAPAVATLEWDAARAAALEQAARAAGVGPEHVVFGAWALALAAHAGTDDVVFGVAADGPDGAAAPVPLRVRVAYGLPVAAYLAAVRDGHAAGAKHAGPSDAELAACADLPPDTALFDKTVRCTRAPDGPSPAGPAPARTLELTCHLAGARPGLRLAYAADRFAAADAGTLLGHLDRLLTAITGAPATATVHGLSPLSAAERTRILREWNDTAVDRGADATARIHELIERQAAATPDAVAVLQGEHRLTYAELDRAADRLARRLAAAGVGPGDFVALHLRRTVHTVVALLGVLKSGAAYAPLEPSLPAERLTGLLRTLAAPVVVTDADAVPAVLDVGAGLATLREVLWLGEPDDEPERPAATGPRVGWGLAEPAPGTAVEPRRAGPDDLAYVIFTSGSTGTPKGVVVTHAPVVNLIRWVNDTFGMGPADRVLFITSLGFDLSVYDVFGVLAAGGSVRVAAAEEVRDPARLLAVLDSEPITFWDSAPAALQQLEPFFALRAARPDHPLRLVFLSGDWIPVTLPDSVRAAFGGPRVVALGGATEAAVWSNVFPVETVDPAWASIPYGRPIDNARYYVLDGGLRPAPVGAPGDLYIGGDCLATGYFGDPALTAAKFLPDPFGDAPGARLYRTGDRARFWADGTIEFLGRQDHQVKVRGFRIELGEIEAALAAAPGVASAVAVVHGEAAMARLVGYAVPAPGSVLAPEELRDHLARRLPPFMVPAHVLVLDALPVTANGKLDRGALPVPGQDGGDAGFVEPTTPMEKALAEMWAEVLGVERIGVEDNFFAIGGHSLLITQVTARIRAALDIDVPLMALLDHQTLGEFAAVVEDVLLEQLDEDGGDAAVTQD